MLARSLSSALPLVEHFTINTVPSPPGLSLFKGFHFRRLSHPHPVYSPAPIHSFILPSSNTHTHTHIHIIYIQIHSDGLLPYYQLPAVPPACSRNNPELPEAAAAAPAPNLHNPPIAVQISKDPDPVHADAADGLQLRHVRCVAIDPDLRVVRTGPAEETLCDAAPDVDCYLRAGGPECTAAVWREGRGVRSGEDGAEHCHWRSFLDSKLFMVSHLPYWFGLVCLSSAGLVEHHRHTSLSERGETQHDGNVPKKTRS